MFLFVHTSNNDEKFDCEFDQILQFFYHEIFTHTNIFLMFIVVFYMGSDLGFGFWDFEKITFIKDIGSLPMLGCN